MEELESHHKVLVDAVLLALEDASPIPIHLTTFARNALSWRSVDSVAIQLSDSSVDDLVGARGASRWRTVHFGIGETELQLSLHDRRLVIELTPSADGSCEVETTRNRYACQVDSSGGFQAEGIEYPFRLALLVNGASWITPWVTG
jgi:hypothetical protein